MEKWEKRFDKNKSSFVTSLLLWVGFCVCVRTALLGYNSHGVKFILLKCAVQVTADGQGEKK